MQKAKVYLVTPLCTYNTTNRPCLTPLFELTEEQSIQVRMQFPMYSLVFTDSSVEFLHPVSVFICLLRIKTFSLRVISFVQMYLNPFFYFSIILGWSRPGGIYRRRVSVVFPYRGANKLPGVFLGVGLATGGAALGQSRVSPLCLCVRCPLVLASASVRDFRWARVPTIYCISARVTHLPSAEQSGGQAGARGPRVLALGVACPSVTSPVPVNCVLGSRTSSPASKRNN